MLAAAETSSRSFLPSDERGYVVPAAPDPTVASRAGAGGATADGAAGLSYGSHIKQLLNRLFMSHLKEVFLPPAIEHVVGHSGRWQIATGSQDGGLVTIVHAPGHLPQA